MPEGAEHIEPGGVLSESINPAVRIGVLMPAFEAIMAQKYRFQVRAEFHSGVVHSVGVAEVAPTALAAAGRGREMPTSISAV